VAIEDWDPSRKQTPREPESGSETAGPLAELVEAAQAVATGLSATVHQALYELVQAHRNNKVRPEQLEKVAALNPDRIKIPDDDKGRRLREAVKAFRGEQGIT
jgi:hypothetical protein